MKNRNALLYVLYEKMIIITGITFFEAFIFMFMTIKSICTVLGIIALVSFILCSIFWLLYYNQSIRPVKED